VTKENKKTVKSLLFASDFFAVKIIFGLKSSIFLPFNLNGNLIADLILVDEANSFYIQEQNSLYYDARDSSFFFSQAFGANLYFVSTLPSVRLYNFNPTLVEQKLRQSLDLDQKDLQIYLTQKNKQVDSYELFSRDIENLLVEED
jgi:primosomal protein N'